jgi:hypothetical protein
MTIRFSYDSSGRPIRVVNTYPLFQLVDQKMFAISNPNIYKAANDPAGSGATIGECPQKTSSETADPTA